MESLISCALEAVHQKKMTVAEAARTFGIPPSTLYARVNGRSSKRGRPCYFTIEQEANLEELIVSCANSGIALSPRILHKVVVNAATAKKVTRLRNEKREITSLGSAAG